VITLPKPVGFVFSRTNTLIADACEAARTNLGELVITGPGLDGSPGKLVS